MIERHHFLVSMLDDRDRKVSIIREKLKKLRTTCEQTFKNEHTHRSTAVSIYHETIQRQSILERKMCSRITEIEQFLTKQTSKQQHSDIQNNSNVIYGLLDKHDDVIKIVNELLFEMNLRNMICISANRTHYRHDIQRQGVVIAELRCMEDKREILKRKRFIRTHPVYYNVFIKSSNSHVEQVMDSNFNVVHSLY